MAQAIAETFGSNGAEDLRPAQPLSVPVATPPRVPDQTPTDAPVDEPVAAPPPSSSTPPSAPVPQAPRIPAAAGLGTALEPVLQNQLGGFMRLMIMKALQAEPEFRAQAEQSLAAQGQADAQRTGDVENPDMLEVAEAWARQRRQLVSPDSVTVEQKAPQSAVIELHECPYGLGPGDAHPVCDVSNVYDVEFFKQFGAEGVYSQRMSDGARRCQLLVVDIERLREFGVRPTGAAEQTQADEATEAQEAPVSDPAQG
jgi:hypothetical protein